MTLISAIYAFVILVLIATLWLIAYENRELRKEITSLTKNSQELLQVIENYANAEADAPPKQYVYRTYGQCGRNVWNRWEYITKEKYDTINQQLNLGIIQNRECQTNIVTGNPQGYFLQNVLGNHHESN